jgi:hypothetical protein
MKKQALKAVTMLVSIIALAFMTALVSNGQSPRKSLRADIPFDFIVGDKALDAGKYVVGAITGSSNEGMLVSSCDGRQNAIRLTSSVQATDSKNIAVHPEPKIHAERRNSLENRARLIFHRYGSTYYLAQVWMPGSSEGREMLKSKAERAARLELAKNPSRDESAQNVEAVTIFADLE